MEYLIVVLVLLFASVSAVFLYHKVMVWMMESTDLFFDDLEKSLEETKEELKVVQKELPTKSRLMSMKKEKIEEVGREFGVELDRRKTKKNMIEDLMNEVQKSD